MFNLFSNQITKLGFESEKQNEKLEIISSAFDKYLPKRFLIIDATSSSGNIFSLIKPLDDNFLTLTGSSTEVIFNFEEISRPTLMTQIRISIFFSYVLSSVVTQSVFIFNWNTNSWFLADTLTITESGQFAQRLITVDNPSLYINANSTVKVRITATSARSFNAYYDFISLKIENNDVNKTIATYILNNSPFSSKIVSAIVFNNTRFERFDLNITIPSSSLFLIKIKTNIINSNIKFITNLGNIFQATISN
jgi:effector-binding domain-containing protein